MVKPLSLATALLAASALAFEPLQAAANVISQVKAAAANSGLQMTLYTASDCTTEKNAGDRGSHVISNMVYGQNYPFQIRSFSLSRTLNPNEVLDFSNWDSNESSARLAMWMTGNAQSCSHHLLSVGFDDQNLGERFSGCHTIASPWLFFGCVSIHTQ